MSDKNVGMSAGEISERRVVTVQGDSEATQMEVYLEVEVDDKSYGLLFPSTCLSTWFTRSRTTS